MSMNKNVEWKAAEGSIIALPTAPTFEKRDKMTRAEWQYYFGEEEITEEEYKMEMLNCKLPLNRGFGG